MNHLPTSMKKVAIYPCHDKIAHALIRFRHLLQYSIEAVIDFETNIGEDIGETLGIGKTGLIVTNDLDSSMEKIDTVIIVDHDGSLIFENKYKELNKDKKFWKVVDTALKYKKDIYSVEINVLERLNAEQKKYVKENNINVYFPQPDLKDYHQIKEFENWESDVSIPVIGIFGTSPNQGKWTTQLTIRELLMKKGLKVGHIGTEPTSYLLGCEHMFDRLPPTIRSHIFLYRHYLRILQKSGYDCIITGGQSGIVPFRLDVNSPVFTIPSIEVLFGANPSAYVLVVNHTDPLHHIRDCILGLQCLGKKKVIALVLPRRKAVSKDKWGDTIYSLVSDEEMEARKRKLYNAFQIPVIDIISDKGRKELTDIVVCNL